MAKMAISMQSRSEGIPTFEIWVCNRGCRFDHADETGWRIGCLNGRVVFTFPDVSAVYMSSPETRESVTTIECINATGSYIPGFLILPGQLLMEGQFENDIHPDCIFATNKESGSGFTNDILAID
jgi:hypothetical protein